MHMGAITHVHMPARTHAHMQVSAKVGLGIEEVLEAIVDRVPAPPNTVGRPLRALIYDSYYDSYRGVITQFRVVDGSVGCGVGGLC